MKKWENWLIDILFGNLSGHEMNEKDYITQ